jgi:predicted RNA-binding Zn-ribbon protein involved in translation (DUF1610 family)
VGQQYKIKCASCEYGVTIVEGVGKMHSPQMIFNSSYNDSMQNLISMLTNRYREKDYPLLLSLVKNKRITDKVFKMLKKGAVIHNDYGYKLFACPKCMRLTNKFYFKILSASEDFEPDYDCHYCKSYIYRVEIIHNNNKRIKIVYKDQIKMIWKCPDCGNDELIFNGGVVMWD